MRRASLVLLVFLLACGPYFYQAPPSLGSYPGRIAAKRWPQLFVEAAPLDPQLPSGKQLDEACRTMLDTLTPLDPARRGAEIDRLLEENRTGDYSSRRANLLYELRELSVDETTFNAARDYLEWRMDRLDYVARAPISIKPWNMEVPDFEKQRERELAAVEMKLRAIDELTQASSASLQPHWKIQRAAYLFEIRLYKDAADDFRSVMESYPDHPRAEVAALMLARCLLEQSRELRRHNGDREEIEALLDESAELLEDFIRKHPQGRFTPDAEGWLGAIAFDRGQWGVAVKQQIARLERKPSREITRTVLRECDMIFEKLMENAQPNDFDDWGIDPISTFDAKAVARQPLVARLFVQHCIDPAASVELPLWFVDRDTSGRETIDFLRRRILNPRPLLRMALRELGREMLRVKSVPDDVTLTLLAWAATEDGEHEQALALVNQVKIPTDESLQAKAIALQRLGRDEAALSAWGALEDMGSSHLTSDLRYQRSLSWFRSGHAGKAIVEIMNSVYPAPDASDDGSEGSSDPLRPHSQLLQWVDTMLQFSPLSELEYAFNTLPASTRQRDVVQAAIRTRALASRNFELAARYLTDCGLSPASSWEWMGSSLGNHLPMGRADWDQRVAPMIALYDELAAASEDRAAEIHLAIARHWMNQRGKLSMPSLAVCYYAASEPEKQGLLRRKNALELGFAPDAIHAELDHRDEATHALEHALEAAKCDDPVIAPAASELANQCLFRRAEVSLYQKSRALEAGASALSLDIHRQLRTRFASSPEARRSVYYTFAPAAGSWMPGDYNSYNAADALVSSIFGRERDSVLPQEEQALDGLGELLKRFDPFDEGEFKDIAAIRRAIEETRIKLTELRPHTDPTAQGEPLQVINRLDDLDAAASVKGASVTDFANYANGTNEKLPAGFASLLEFRANLSPLLSPDGFELGPRNDTIAAWRDFLLKYPDSPMAEAASFRMTRLIARQFRSHRRIAAIHFPAAPIPEGYKQVLVKRSNMDNDTESVLAAIRDHEDRFPQGRYRDDLNLLRAGVLIDQRKYSQALALLENILGNPQQGDLHVVAALEFADVAQQLLEPEKRLAIASAFRRAPGAMAHLHAVVNGDTFLSRLKPMMTWIMAGEE